MYLCTEGEWQFASTVNLSALWKRTLSLKHFDVRIDKFHDLITGCGVCHWWKCPSVCVCLCVLGRESLMKERERKWKRDCARIKYLPFYHCISFVSFGMCVPNLLHSRTEKYFSFILHWIKMINFMSCFVNAYYVFTWKTMYIISSDRLLYLIYF